MNGVLEWRSWLFSAKRAWQNPWTRWITVMTFFLVLTSSLWFLWKIIPARRPNGTAVLHYTIYLGIDAVRPWWWVFFLPLTWILVTALDLLLAFGYHRKDPHFSFSLFALALAWSVPWVVALFYLVRINL